MQYIDGFCIYDEDIDCVKAQFDIIVAYHRDMGFTNFKIKEVRPDYLELWGIETDPYDYDYGLD